MLTLGSVPVEVGDLVQACSEVGGVAEEAGELGVGLVPELFGH